MPQWKIIYLDECDSTNTRLHSMREADPNLAEGLIIRSDFQSAGRGQRGAKWEAEAGKNLLFSVLLKPLNLDAGRAHFLNYILSLSVLDCLRDTAGDLHRIFFKVKWPNDVFYKNKKICGVLCENHIAGSGIISAVCGVGININQENSAGISLSSICGETQNINEVFTRFLMHLNNYYALLSHEQYNRLEKYYTASLLYLNCKAAFADAQGSFRGTIRGIDARGRILIQKESGVLKAYANKEVIFVNS